MFQFQGGCPLERLPISKDGVLWSFVQFQRISSGVPFNFRASGFRSISKGGVSSGFPFNFKGGGWASLDFLLIPTEGRVIWNCFQSQREGGVRWVSFQLQGGSSEFPGNFEGGAHRMPFQFRGLCSSGFPFTFQRWGPYGGMHKTNKPHPKIVLRTLPEGGGGEEFRKYIAGRFSRSGSKAIAARLLPGRLVVWLRGYQVAELYDCLVVLLPGGLVAWLPGCMIV